MGQIHPPARVLLLLGATSRHAGALAWSAERLASTYGRVALASPAFDFRETDYYIATMGTDLKKQFLVCEEPIDPASLAAIKRQTNDWEAEYRATAAHAEERPLNLDPGYLTPAKLVLASTKDHAHRIHLHDGIYAEVTLSFRHGAWHAQPWTYPDYRREDFQAFFCECRKYLLAHRKK